VGGWPTSPPAHASRCGGGACGDCPTSPSAASCARSVGSGTASAASAPPSGSRARVPPTPHPLAYGARVEGLHTSPPYILDIYIYIYSPALRARRHVCSSASSSAGQHRVAALARHPHPTFTAYDALRGASHQPTIYILHAYILAPRSARRAGMSLRQSSSAGKSRERDM
jgi:hypothetical protein